MPARLHVPALPPGGGRVALPQAALRHAQVLRLQPGDALVLFDGSGAEWEAKVASMGRGSVEVDLGRRSEPARELAVAVTLAVGMPANERMDTLVEKATELGAAAIQPLVCERSVLRLAGERAARRVAHWQAIAVAACEQSGRVVVPSVAPVRPFAEWLAALPAVGSRRLVLSLDEGARPLRALLDEPQPAPAALLALSGPEGGLAPAEEAAARRCGFVAATLGPRVLRADTAPLALLAAIGLR